MRSIVPARIKIGVADASSCRFFSTRRCWAESQIACAHPHRTTNGFLPKKKRRSDLLNSAAATAPTEAT